MARPRKAGLSYFPLDVDIFDADYKIIDLLDRFGPKGFAVYIAILCMVYREGYYLEIPMRSLQVQLGKMIGNRWLTDKTIIPDVISYCGELGLFDAGLLQQGVITSAGIQRRYQAATKRNKSRIDKYRLLGAETSEAGESVPETSVSASKTGVSVTETPISDAKTPQRKEKERKENKTKGNSLPGGREKKTPPVKSGGQVPPPDERGCKDDGPYHLYGRFRNVRLTDAEYAALKEEVVERDALIDQLSIHMEATGAQYPNHFARLIKWEMEDRKRGKKHGKPSFDLEAFEKQGFDLPDKQLPVSYDIREFEKGGFDLPDLWEDDNDSKGSKR